MDTYEKKYKEALEKFRRDLGKHELVGVNRAYLEDIFPELAKSEDEKIRKELYESIRRCNPREIADKYIAWLEKQGEQKPATHKYNVGATIYYNSFGKIKSMVVANVIDTGDGNPMYEDADDSAVFEKAIVEQKPVEEVNGEDYGIDSLWHAVRILEKTYGKVDGYQTDDGILSHECAITAVKKLKEQKPVEWSEEDEICLEEVKQNFRVNKDNMTPSLIEQYERFFTKIKSLRPQKQQEWNVDDFHTLESIIEEYDERLKKDANNKEIQRKIHLLESMRVHPIWRPTEKELDNLQKAVSGLIADKSVLIRLHTHLKAL